jgi:ubiquinone/menaquinone biosynthesis C-methylase UbiE
MRGLDEIKLRDKNSKNYDEWYMERGYNAVVSEDDTIFSKLNLNCRVENFLDLGSGTCRFTVKIHDRYPSINCYALDISPKSIDILNSKKRNIKASVFDASSGNLSTLNYPKFDRILSMQMIQHLDKRGSIHVINEMYALLDVGGIAVVELYNFNGLNRIIERIKALFKIKKIQKSGSFYEYRYSADEFKYFAENTQVLKMLKSMVVKIFTGH